MDPDDANALHRRDVFVRHRHAAPPIRTCSTRSSAGSPTSCCTRRPSSPPPLAAEATGVPAVCVGITAGVAHASGSAEPIAEALDERPRASSASSRIPSSSALHATPYFTLDRRRRSRIPAAPGPDRTRCASARPTARAAPAAGLVAQRRRGRSSTSRSARSRRRWTTSPALYRDAIDALAELPVRVLVTVGRDRDPRELGPVGAERARRALGAAGRRDAARRRDGLPRRLRHGARGPRGGRADGGACRCSPTSPTTPVASPSSAPASTLEADDRGSPDAVRRLLAEPLLPRGGAARRRRRRAAADRRHRDRDRAPAGAGGLAA